jgi:hypothetical protein
VSKIEIEKEIAARRAEITEMENRIIRQTTESATLREENRELKDRLNATEKRLVALESALTAASQKPVEREATKAIQEVPLETARQRSPRESARQQVPLETARQLAPPEKPRPQVSFSKVSMEVARGPYQLIDAEAILSAAQTRLREVEGNMALVNTERARLAAARNVENRKQELIGQRKQFEAVQARAKASEKALVEARKQLLARAEDVRPSQPGVERAAVPAQAPELQADRTNRASKAAVQPRPMSMEVGAQQTRASNAQAAALARAEEARANDRRAKATAMHRDALLAELEAERKNRASKSADAGQVRPLSIAGGAPRTAAYSPEAKALARAEEANTALSERIGRLEAALAAEKQGSTAAIEDIKAALRREKMERLATEGALEIARKDFARLMRKAMAMQRDKPADEPTTPPSAAEAA